MVFITYGTPVVALFLLLCASFDFSSAVFTFAGLPSFFFSRLHLVLLSMLHRVLPVCHAVSADRVALVPIWQTLLMQFFKSKHKASAAKLTTVVT